MPSPRHRRILRLILTSVLMLCLGATTFRAWSATTRIYPGIDVLMAEPVYRDLLAGKRIGLITNRAAVTRTGRTTFQVLREAGLGEVVAVFSPEHGFFADREGCGRTEIGAWTGRSYSLHGATPAPTPEMLADVDMLVFDLQSVGVRFYTYFSTMALALEAAHTAGIPFVVLDRPNPIAPQGVGGGLLEDGPPSFHVQLPIPLRYGLTLGEMARYLVFKWPEQYAARLFVVPVQGWSHDLWFDQTGLPWVAPSPAMLDMDTAISYPGFCLLEGTNLSVGRGTPHPFQVVLAPWLDPAELVTGLADFLPLFGADVRPITVIPEDPGDGKYAGQVCHGVRVLVTDRQTYEPLIVAIRILQLVRYLYPQEFSWSDRHFDRLAGADSLRLTVDAQLPVRALMREWRLQTDLFEDDARGLRLYP